MILTVSREDFRSCVTALARVAPAESPLEVILGIHLLADVRSQTLTLTATSLLMGLRYTINAEVEEGGSIVLNAILLNDILRLAGSKEVRMQTAENTDVVTVDAGCVYNLSYLLGEDFPACEFMAPDERTMLKALPSLAARIVQVAANKISENNCHGVRLLFGEKELKAICCDGGSRVIQVTRPANNRETMELIIPAKALGFLSTLVSEEGVLYVGRTENCAIFYDGDMMLSVRLLGDNFLNTDRMLGSMVPRYTAILDKAALCQVLEVALAIPGADRVRIELRNDCLAIGSSVGGATCSNSVSIKQGNGPAETPFYYGRSLLRSIEPLGDTLTLLFSEEGLLFVVDGGTVLLQTPMRPPTAKCAEKSAEPKTATGKKKKEKLEDAA